MTARATTPGGRLARLGFADPGRAEALLQDRALTGFADPLDDVFHDGLPDALSAAADPDQALLGLVRLIESLRDRGMRARTTTGSDGRRPGADRDGEDKESAALLVALRRPGPARDRLVAVLGGSIALVDHLVGHPEHWRCVAEATRPTAAGLRESLVAAVGPDQTGGPERLRRPADRLPARAAGHRRPRPHRRPTPWATSRRPRSSWPGWPRRRWRPAWPSPARSTARAPPTPGSR